MTILEDPPAGEGADEPIDLAARLRNTQIGRSIFRTPRKVTPRDRAASHWASFLLHIYPVKVRKSDLAFKYSYYLGVISTVLFGSLILSGIYL
ncbi:MAG: hypothetical protein HKN24_06640, partial [Acidimicrobiales bacterium]|nr:hypothetical protein [Acidimicrobiales bacterium]